MKKQANMDIEIEVRDDDNKFCSAFCRFHISDLDHCECALFDGILKVDNKFESRLRTSKCIEMFK